MIEIANGDMRLRAAPELGGAATRLSWKGRDILRPAPEGAADVLLTSCFPLAPFANRIAYGRFTFQGRDVQLARNFGDHPHSLHGHAWQRPWRVDDRRQDRLRLSFDYAPGDWPWPYRCEQEFDLQHAHAMFRLSLENRGDTPMPASLGYHPYFPRAHATLRTAALGYWRANDTMLPARHEKELPGFLTRIHQGVGVGDAPFFDNCLTDWNGDLEVSWPGHGVRVRAGEARFLHLYTPSDEAFFCAEPVTAMPDAVNHADDPDGGLVVLAPGEKLQLWMNFEPSADGARGVGP